MREGDDILFRGGVMDVGEYYWFYNEDGTSGTIIYITSGGIAKDEKGNPVDRMKPSLSTIYELTHTPELTHKGHGLAWFVAVFGYVINAISILFADELFYRSLAFRIRNAEYAEPSEWVIASRYIVWTAMTVVVLVLLIMGLQ